MTIRATKFLLIALASLAVVAGFFSTVLPSDRKAKTLLDNIAEGEATIDSPEKYSAIKDFLSQTPCKEWKFGRREYTDGIFLQALNQLEGGSRDLIYLITEDCALNADRWTGVKRLSIEYVNRRGGGYATLIAELNANLVKIALDEIDLVNLVELAGDRFFIAILQSYSAIDIHDRREVFERINNRSDIQDRTKRLINEAIERGAAGGITGVGQGRRIKRWARMGAGPHHVCV